LKRARIKSPTKVAVGASIVASTIICLTAAASGAAAGGGTTLQAPNGGAGAETGTGQGSDQGEDQGENIFQFGAGALPIGPTSVRARNAIRSGNVGAGRGGNATVIFNNYVTTTCGSAATTIVPLPQTVDIKAGNGGAGGSTGHGQGADQGEDQGENVGQLSLGGAGLSPTAVSAVNTIRSGSARGGNGGMVSVTVNTFTTCGHALHKRKTPTPTPPPSAAVTRAASGDIHATYTTYVTCQVTAPQSYSIQAGDGGAGGTSGKDQGADQGEDQGENIGQFASGSSRGGPTVVRAPRNFLSSSDATGSGGANVTATFDNYIDLTCAPGGSGATPGGSVQATAGTGGAGGETGVTQGSDQGEDQGENIGQFAKGGVSVGPASVRARNVIVSGSATGGRGGDVTVTYNDYGTCTGTTPTTTVDEGIAATAGAGGAGGNSGGGQGSDQGEDQGENVGQFASGGAYLGSVGVRARNTNLAGGARGGAGGSVSFAYNAGSCSVPLASSNQLAVGTAGNGGAGGSSGKDQGADQGEDQGENIGQFSSGFTRLGAVSVRAVNLNVSGDVSGGNGGNVLVPGSAGSCSTPDTRVLPTPGAGGAAGDSGVGQGSDQGEDQGENIGMGASTGGRGRTTVWAANNSRSGPARAGAPGTVKTPCQSAAASFSPPWLHWLHVGTRLATTHAGGPPQTAPDPGQVRCDGVFRGRALDLEVPFGGVCHIRPGAVIKHNVDVAPGGSLFAVGATIGHDLAADQPRSVHISGGRVGHDLLVEAPGFRGARSSVQICAVHVGHNLLVADSPRNTSPIMVGGPRRCRGNVVGTDLSVEVNLGRAIVQRNRAGHDANCFENGSLSARGNRAVHLNNCPPIFG